MKNHPVIQRLIAFLLVLLFTFSITPKKYWHDAVANHTDYYAVFPAKETGVSQKGLNCQADDLVVKAPFIETPLLFEEEAVTVFLAHPAPYYLSYQFTGLQAKDSRGPPALV